MRYDKQVYFVKEGTKTYDPNTGDYTVSKPIKTMKWANISDAGTETLKILFGEIKQGTKIIRLKNNYKEPFDYIEIDGEKYTSTLKREYRMGCAFYVGESQ